MKKFKRFFTFLFLIAICILAIPNEAFAKELLDEIQDYELIVDMRNDGTMDIKYHIEWKVLDDSSEGPLSWVKIGIPNKHVDEIQASSSNINEIKYMAESGKTYIEVHFDREYYANEIISFDFSIHQSHMYVIDEEDHLLRYSFTPGWFDEIEVKNIVIKWNDFNVIKSNSKQSENGYLVWNSSLSYGEKMNASVSYNLDAFNTNKDEQYKENESTIDGMMVIIIICVIILAIIVIGAIVCAVSDGYDDHSGFGGNRTSYHTTYIHHSSCVSHCACVSSCACACACAGGGRAGCSKKDFYATKLNSNMIQEVLKEDLK